MELEWRFKTVLVMVGLPARGKSYISKKLVNYQCWLGFQARFFNVGNHRRDVCQGKPQTSDFFDAKNENAKNAREAIALEVLDDLLDWLRDGGDVAVFDATNTTEARRAVLVDRCKAVSEAINVIFIESICDDPNVIHRNCMQKVIGSPDYRNMPQEEALNDLKKRIANYEKVYETIKDDSLSYIKLINLQSKVICNKIFGTLAQRTGTFLMSLNLHPRKIWLCRAGQADGVEDFNNIKIQSPKQSKRDSKGNTIKRVTIKDRSDYFTLPPTKSKAFQLGTKGKVYAQNIKEFISAQTDDFEVYSSTIVRAVQTAREIHPRTQQWPSLNMLHTGNLDGMSIYEIKEKFPSDFEEFMNDPFHYRIPGGESFEDVVHRVEPFIIELERQTKDALVISHLSTLRVIMAYFLGTPVEEFSLIDIPQNTLIELVPYQYGWKQRNIPIQDE